MRAYRDLHVAAKAVVLLAVLSVLVVGMIEGACRSGDFYSSTEWQVRYGPTPWVDATELENCRINLKHFGRRQITALVKDPVGHWPELGPWHRATVIAAAAITALFLLDLLLTAVIPPRPRTQPPDKHEVRSKARRRL